MDQQTATLTRPRPAQPPTASPTASQTGSLLGLIGRIEEAVQAETDAIRTDINFDVAASNARKSRYLYDLNKAARGLTEAGLRDEHRAALNSLKRTLTVNEQAILAHLNAVREVADLLQGAIRRSETDGTYSANEFGRS